MRKAWSQTSITWWDNVANKKNGLPLMDYKHSHARARTHTHTHTHTHTYWTDNIESHNSKSCRLWEVAGQWNGLVCLLSRVLMTGINLSSRAQQLPETSERRRVEHPAPIHHICHEKEKKYVNVNVITLNQSHEATCVTNEWACCL